jgi:hypothetical protein
VTHSDSRLSALVAVAVARRRPVDVIAMRHPDRVRSLVKSRKSAACLSSLPPAILRTGSCNAASRHDPHPVTDTEDRSTSRMSLSNGGASSVTEDGRSGG